MKIISIQWCNFIDCFKNDLKIKEMNESKVVSLFHPVRIYPSLSLSLSLSLYIYIYIYIYTD